MENPILPPGIRKNMGALLMFAALVTGGVEMRLKVQDVHDDHVLLAQELREHEHQPGHNNDALAIQQAVQAAVVDDVKKRLEKLETGQNELQRGITEVLSEVKAVRKEQR